MRSHQRHCWLYRVTVGLWPAPLGHAQRSTEINRADRRARSRVETPAAALFKMHIRIGSLEYAGRILCRQSGSTFVLMPCVLFAQTGRERRDSSNDLMSFKSVCAIHAIILIIT